jgi:hypothetical protein
MRLCLLVLAAGLAQAQFFPLQVGNQWIYRLDEGPVKDLRVAEILGAETVEEKEYFHYKGISGEIARVRLTADSKLVQRNADGSESLWADFAAGPGESFPTAVDACTGRGMVESREATTEMLNRTWGGGLRVRYAAANCADAGISVDLYLPGLGLAERTYQSFTGPRRFKLTYARIGNASVVTGGEFGFRLTLNQKTYTTRALIQPRMTLENWTGEPLKLRFFSGQSFDFSIRNEAGETVYTWSSNKLFIAEVREITVTGEQNWTASEELDLKPGEYVVEAWITNGRTPVFKAQVPITVAAMEPAK